MLPVARVPRVVVVRPGGVPAPIVPRHSRQGVSSGVLSSCVLRDIDDGFQFVVHPRSDPCVAVLKAMSMLSAALAGDGFVDQVPLVCASVPSVAPLQIPRPHVCSSCVRTSVRRAVEARALG